MRTTLRAVMLIAFIAAVLAAIGALRYGSSERDVTITIDKERVRDVADEVIEKGKELGNRLTEQVSESPVAPEPEPNE